MLMGSALMNRMIFSETIIFKTLHSAILSIQTKSMAKSRGWCRYLKGFSNTLLGVNI